MTFLVQYLWILDESSYLWQWYPEMRKMSRNSILKWNWVYWHNSFGCELYCNKQQLLSVLTPLSDAKTYEELVVRTHFSKTCSVLTWRHDLPIFNLKESELQKVAFVSSFSNSLLGMCWVEREIIYGFLFSIVLLSYTENHTWLCAWLYFTWPQMFVGLEILGCKHFQKHPQPRLWSFIVWIIWYH